MFIGHISTDRIENQNGVRVQPGGAALYAAMAARTLLKDITLISAIGKDFKFKDNLQLFHSDHIRTVNMPSTRFNIKYNKRWEAEYLKAIYGAGSKISASIIPTQLLGPETMVHISPMQPIKVSKIFKKIREASPETKISINTWIEYITKSRRTREVLKNLALEADFFILNDHEAKSLAETDSISTALALLRARRLIITLGELGAITSKENREIQMAPALNTPTRSVVDTTGAGDVWCGGFLAAYKLTDDLMKSITIASILSSIKCSDWNFQKLLKLRFRNPDDVIEYVIGLKEGSLQKRISDYTKDIEKGSIEDPQ
jgi:sugar/nucleoside kinase (ribokinase family)